MAEHAFYIPRDGVDFEVDPAAGVQVAECGVLDCVRDQVDADVAAIGLVVHLVDRKAHAIDGDGAFVGQVFGQTVWRQDAQLPAFAHLGKVADVAHAIDVA